jgi:hypothetical protein
MRSARAARKSRRALGRVMSDREAARVAVFVDALSRVLGVHWGAVLTGYRLHAGQR